MRVDFLSSPDPVRATSAASLTEGPRLPSFSEAMARTSPAEGFETSSVPTRPLPTSKNASPSNFRAQASQAWRVVPSSDGGVPASALTNKDSEVQSGGKLNGEANPKGASQLTLQATSKATLRTAINATVTPTIPATSGADTFSPSTSGATALTSTHTYRANVDVKANAIQVAQPMALSVAKDALSSMVTNNQGHQVAEDTISPSASVALSTPSLVTSPLAPLPTSNGFHAPNAPAVVAASTPARGAWATTGLAGPTLVAPDEVMPSSSLPFPWPPLAANENTLGSGESAVSGAGFARRRITS